MNKSPLLTLVGFGAAAGTPFDPEKIGRAFLNYYRLPAPPFQLELQSMGAAG